MSGMEIIISALIGVLLIGVGLMGVAGPVCETARAREEAPQVGVVEDVEVTGGYRPHTYIQVDGCIYTYDSEGPVPAEGAVIEYRPAGDRAIDVEVLDLGDRGAHPAPESPAEGEVAPGGGLR